MGRRASASRRAPFTRRVKAARIDGRTEGGSPKGSKKSSISFLLSRLRRLEFAVLYLCGENRQFDLDRFVKDVLSLEADAKIESRGRNVRRGEIQVPHEGSTPGETAREAEDFRGLASGHEDGDASPFSPGAPDEDH